MAHPIARLACSQRTLWTRLKTRLGPKSKWVNSKRRKRATFPKNGFHSPSPFSSKKIKENNSKIFRRKYSKNWNYLWKWREKSLIYQHITYHNVWGPMYQRIDTICNPDTYRYVSCIISSLGTTLLWCSIFVSGAKEKSIWPWQQGQVRKKSSQKSSSPSKVLVSGSWGGAIYGFVKTKGKPTLFLRCKAKIPPV